MGVDCVRFAAAIWDELAGLTYAQGAAKNMPRMAQSGGLHAAGYGQASRALRELGKIHDIVCVEPDPHGVFTVEPGDMIACRLGSHGAPGHVMIVGPDANNTYHACVGQGVVRRQLPALGEFYHIWRAKDRDIWPL